VIEFPKKVIIGNAVVYPAQLRNFLVKSHYYLIYEPDKEKLTLYANHDTGGQALFELRNASYESAVKMAQELGLDESQGKYPLMWTKWNPILSVHDNGSEESEKIKMEVLRLGMPHINFRGEKIGFSFGTNYYGPPSYTLSGLIKELNNIAQRYRKQLDTKP
jgi:hypothetical protein